MHGNSSKGPVEDCIYRKLCDRGKESEKISLFLFRLCKIVMDLVARSSDRHCSHLKLLKIVSYYGVDG